MCPGYSFVKSVNQCRFHAMRCDPTECFDTVREYFQANCDDPDFLKEFGTVTNCETDDEYLTVLIIKKCWNDERFVKLHNHCTDDILLEIINEANTPYGDVQAFEICYQHFVDSYLGCQCSFTLKFNKRNISHLRIGDRVDLIQKYVLEGTSSKCFDTYLTDGFELIRNNLRKIDSQIETKCISDIHGHKQSQLITKFKYESVVYLDENYNFVSSYLYIGEDEPNIMYAITANNASYCVLCLDVWIQNYIDINNDTKKPKMCVCHNMCDKLKARVYGDKREPRFPNQMKKLKYAKNRLLLLYMIFDEMSHDVIMVIANIYLSLIKNEISCSL